MQAFANRLRERARQLGLSDAEVARRAGLTERRYGHYVTGTREPNLGTLLRICAVLESSPNDLLADGAPPTKTHSQRIELIDRLMAAAKVLTPDDLRLAVRLISSMVDHRRRPSPAKASKRG